MSTSPIYTFFNEPETSRTLDRTPPPLQPRHRPQYPGFNMCLAADPDAIRLCTSTPAFGLASRAIAGATLRKIMDHSPPPERAVQTQPTQWIGEPPSRYVFETPLDFVRRASSLPATPVVRHAEEVEGGVLSPRPVRCSSLPLFLTAHEVQPLASVPAPSAPNDLEPAVPSTPSLASAMVFDQSGLDSPITPSKMDSPVYLRMGHRADEDRSASSSRTATPTAVSQLPPATGSLTQSTSESTIRGPPTPTPYTARATVEVPYVMCSPPSFASTPVHPSPTGTSDSTKANSIELRTPQANSNDDLVATTPPDRPATPAPSAKSYAQGAGLGLGQGAGLGLGLGLTMSPEEEESPRSPTPASFQTEPVRAFAFAPTSLKSSFAPVKVSVDTNPKHDFFMQEFDIQHILRPLAARKAREAATAAASIPAASAEASTIAQQPVSGPEGVTVESDDLAHALSSNTHSVQARTSELTHLVNLLPLPNVVAVQRFEREYIKWRVQEQQPALFTGAGMDANQVEWWVLVTCNSLFDLLGIEAEDHLTRITAVRQVLTPSLRIASYIWKSSSRSSWPSFGRRLCRHLESNRQGDREAWWTRDKSTYAGKIIRQFRDTFNPSAGGLEAEMRLRRESPEELFRRWRLENIGRFICYYNNKRPKAEGDGPGDCYTFSFLEGLDICVLEAIVDAMFNNPWPRHRIGRLPWNLYEVIEAAEEYLAIPAQRLREVTAELPPVRQRLFRYRKFSKVLKYVSAEDYNAHHARMGVIRGDAQTYLVRVLEYIEPQYDAPAAPAAHYFSQTRSYLMEAIARNPKNGNMKYNARLLEEYDRKLADQAKDLPPGHGSRLDDLMDSIRTATESHRLTGLVGSWAGRRFLTPRHSANESGPVGSSTSAQASIHA